MKLGTTLPTAALIGLGLFALPGSDWPQFRGPLRDGVSREADLMKTWPAGGPKLAWTYTGAGVGYSGPAVVGERLYMCGGRGADEFVFALDLDGAVGNNVKEVWSTKIGPLFQWKENTWNAGPNATPTVDGELLYALGGQGELLCVETATGKERWRKNLPRDLGGEVNPIGGGSDDPTPLGWGYSSAPLVDGDKLICVPGGRQGLMAALDKKTGRLLWQSKEIVEQASYSSPLAVEVAGIRQYIQVINSGIVGIAADSGKLLWRYVRDPAYDDVVVATPIFHDNHVFATVGFQQGCDLIKLVPKTGGAGFEKVFSNKTMDNRDGGVVLMGDHLYAYSENRGWVCQEFKMGKVVWAEKNKLGRGSLVGIPGHLICTSEKQDSVVLVEATPKGWTEKGRFQLPRASRLRKPSGGLWTHPVVANGKLYVRDQELVFCYELK